MGLMSGWRGRVLTAASALTIYFMAASLVAVNKIHISKGARGSALLAASGSGGAGQGERSAAAQQRMDTGRHLRGSPQMVSDGISGAMLRAVPAARLTPKRLRASRMLGPTIDWCKKPLRFKSPPGPTVALASFPGSGNTWLRYLLQQATGLLTGSVYKDYALLKNGFPGENVSNGSVIAVKTHEFGPDALASFDKAVLLVRDPFASLQAEFNRRSGGHVGHAPADKYKRNGRRGWTNFVQTKTEEWGRMNLAWFQAFSPSATSLSYPEADGEEEERLLVVRYEDLASNTEHELRRVLRFLRWKEEEEGDESVGDRTGDDSLACVMRRKEGIYKRARRPLGFDVFSREMRAAVGERVAEVYSTLGVDVPLTTTIHPPPTEEPTDANGKAPSSPAATGQPSATPFSRTPRMIIKR